MTTEQQLEIARLWANADGCEGGDLLNALCEVCEMAHYSYHDEDTLEKALLAMIGLEIAAHKKMATGPDPENFGYEPATVQEVLDRIEEIKSEHLTDRH